MNTLITILHHTWEIVLELSPWLLLGMFIAGILHVLLPEGFIRRHLGRKRFWSVFKAVSIGVPMPLCSCGVIPAALGLKKDGASDGAVTGFLISTPQTGVDSILVSATFLGWPFALFKVLSALLSGLLGGLLVNATDHSPPPHSENCSCSHCADNNHARPRRPFKEIFQFGFIQLLRDIYRWLIVGILIAALISTFIPTGRLADISLTQGLPGMFLMLLVSLPMYICATASVPLAAALVTAGMSPGAALVLLMAGPASNVATLAAVYRGLGQKVLVIYIATLSVMSITLGSLFDGLLRSAPAASQHLHSLPAWLHLLAAILLLTLLAYFAAADLLKLLRARRHPKPCCHNHPH